MKIHCQFKSGEREGEMGNADRRQKAVVFDDGGC